MSITIFLTVMSHFLMGDELVVWGLGQAQETITNIKTEEIASSMELCSTWYHQKSQSQKSYLGSSRHPSVVDSFTWAGTVHMNKVSMK